jgi:methylmalonyl-CoA/ethylmalonyl-CoA epimerase
MISRVDHLGIAVRSLDETLAFYRDALGLEVTEVETVLEQKVRVAIMPVGEVRVELLESTDPEGPVAKFIESRGEGLHHVAFRVDDLEATLAALAGAGVRLIDTKPRIGAGGAKIAFIHPKAGFGVLYELCQRDGADH